MKKLPIITFCIIVFISVIISALNGISFYVFLTRTALFYILILIGLNLLVRNIISIKGNRDNTRNSSVSKTNIQTDNTEDFTPLDFREYEKIFRSNETNKVK